MAASDHRRVIAVSDAHALAQAAADRILARVAANGDRVAICLTGGSSPKQLYQLLATEAYRSRIPWDRVHWFIGDERFVPANDPLNNMGAARRIFLDRNAPASNIHPIPTDTASPHEAARRYEDELKSFYGADRLDAARPLFDVVLMGVGPDGHTASLFPRTKAIEEQQRWVVGNWVEQHSTWRITFTYPVLNAAANVMFLMSGESKAEIVYRVLRDPSANLPSQKVQPVDGNLMWYMDKGSAASL